MQGLVGPAKDAVGELYFLILFQLIIFPQWLLIIISLVDI